MRYHCTSIIMTKVKLNNDFLSFNKDVEEQKVSYTAGRDENVTITLENRLAVS